MSTRSILPNVSLSRSARVDLFNALNALRVTQPLPYAIVFVFFCFLADVTPVKERKKPELKTETEATLSQSQRVHSLSTLFGPMINDRSFFVFYCFVLISICRFRPKVPWMWSLGHPLGLAVR